MPDVRTWRERERRREVQERRERAARLKETSVVGDLAVSGAANTTFPRVDIRPGEPERTGVSLNRPGHDESEGNDGNSRS